MAHEIVRPNQIGWRHQVTHGGKRCLMSSRSGKSIKFECNVSNLHVDVCSDQMLLFENGLLEFIPRFTSFMHSCTDANQESPKTKRPDENYCSSIRNVYTRFLCGYSKFACIIMHLSLHHCPPQLLGTI